MPTSSVSTLRVQPSNPGAFPVGLSTPGDDHQIAVRKGALERKRLLDSIPGFCPYYALPGVPGPTLAPIYTPRVTYDRVELDLPLTWSRKVG